MENQFELFESPKSVDTSKEIKTCIKCNEEKPVEYFVNQASSLKQNGEKIIQRICKKCRSHLAGQTNKLRKIHPYPEEGYVCPICLKTPEQIIPETNGNVVPFCIDHDHKTGAFKGWICAKCNSALGFFEDNADYVRRAAKYLDDYEKRT
tara:strand:- start:400 stop:849 length:450 start_codon:yes stop_codon:yes gene_type:complete